MISGPRYIMKREPCLVMTMADKKAIFGWKAVFSYYSLKDFAKDVTIPFMLSGALCACVYFSENNIYNMLGSVLSTGLTVTPVMVTLIVAAYTIILSFLMDDKTDNIKKNAKGKEFLKSLNSSFAVALFLSLFTILVMIVTKNDMHIVCEYAEVLNYVTYFVVSFLLILSVYILYGIMIDIFNSGQTSML